VENFMQLVQIFNQFTEMKIDSVDEIRKEIFELLSGADKKTSYEFIYTEKDNLNKVFKHGCDFVVKYFDEYFKNSFDKAK
jgi:uncharacterized protein YaaN involved in tellurite resistance